MSISVEKIHEFTGHSSGIYCLSPGNQLSTLFSGSGDKFVAEWDLVLGVPEKFSVKLNSTPYSVCHIRSKTY